MSEALPFIMRAAEKAHLRALQRAGSCPRRKSGGARGCLPMREKNAAKAAERMKTMIRFNDSAFEKLTPFRFSERHTRPPRVFPAYIGDGMNVMSIDATGLQGLNHGVPNYHVDGSFGDLYVVRHGMVGDQITPNNHAPLGWMDWEIRFAGNVVTAKNFEEAASNWERTLFIDEARTQTEFILWDQVRVRLSVFMPYGRNAIVVEAAAKAYDHSNQPVKEAVPVEVDLRWHFTNRRTGAALHALAQNGNTVEAVTEGHETYRWTLTANGAGARYEERSMLCTTALNAWNEWSGKTVIFSINGAVEESADALRIENRRSWSAYYDRIASVEGISEEEKYLYNNALFLFRACFNPKYGYPIGFPFDFPSYWHCSVFWDTTFVMDGLMRAGDKEAATAFLDFLYNARRPARKPFVWMCMYDGTPTVDESRDIAPLVLAAHATTAMRYYEYYGEKLEERVFPILKWVVDYAVEELFDQEDGAWILAQNVSHDVCEAEAFEYNHTYTHVWFLAVLDKYAEYAALLGRDVDPRIPEILANHRLEIRNGVYDHCRGVHPLEAKEASWLPFLLYPTDAQPYVDMKTFANTRAVACFNELYMSKQGSFQPWSSMMQMMSDLRLGENELAWSDYEAAMEYVFGPGYFAEIGPHQQTGGFPPYATAEGIYLSATLYPMVRSSVRGSELGLFDGLDLRRRGGSYAVKNVQVMQNAKVSAQLCPGCVKAQIDGELKGVTVRALAPAALRSGELRVTVDEVPVEYRVEKHVKDRCCYVSFRLPDGAKRVFIG